MLELEDQISNHTDSPHTVAQNIRVVTTRRRRATQRKQPKSSGTDGVWWEGRTFNLCSAVGYFFMQLASTD